MHFEFEWKHVEFKWVEIHRNTGKSNDGWMDRQIDYLSNSNSVSCRVWPIRFKFTFMNLKWSQFGCKSQTLCEHSCSLEVLWQNLTDFVELVCDWTVLTKLFLPVSDLIWTEDMRASFAGQMDYFFVCVCVRVCRLGLMRQQDTQRRELLYLHSMDSQQGWTRV